MNNTKRATAKRVAVLAVTLALVLGCLSQTAGAATFRRKSSQSISNHPSTFLRGDVTNSTPLYSQAWRKKP